MYEYEIIKLPQSLSVDQIYSSFTENSTVESIELIKETSDASIYRIGFDGPRVTLTQYLTAEENIPIRINPISLPDIYWQAPLRVLADWSTQACFETLLLQHATVDISIPGTFCTLAECYALQSNFEQVETLLQLGADPNPVVRGLVQSNHLEKTEPLIEQYPETLYSQFEGVLLSTSAEKLSNIIDQIYKADINFALMTWIIEAKFHDQATQLYEHYNIEPIDILIGKILANKFDTVDISQHKALLQIGYDVALCEAMSQVDDFLGIEQYIKLANAENFHFSIHELVSVIPAYKQEVFYRNIHDKEIKQQILPYIDMNITDLEVLPLAITRTDYMSLVRVMAKS